MAKKKRRNKSRSKPDSAVPSQAQAPNKAQGAPTGPSFPGKKTTRLLDHAAWPPLLLVALAAVLYIQTLRFGYALDDNSVISSNRWVQQGLGRQLIFAEYQSPSRGWKRLRSCTSSRVDFHEIVNRALLKKISAIYYFVPSVCVHTPPITAVVLKHGFRLLSTSTRPCRSS